MVVLIFGGSMRESRVETTFVRLAKRHGWKVRKVSWPGRRGAPDRLIMRPGSKPYLVELKRPKGGRLSALQKIEHAELRACGFLVLVLNTIEAVEQWFEPAAPDFL